ncbi:MAG: tetratricopeptide repeat protein [Bacteroidales bacterium]|nr:tetratricopeptide repeat protein [Bacteroidales bacterium]
MKNWVILALILISSVYVYGDHFSDSLEMTLTKSSGEQKFNTLIQLSRIHSRSDFKKSKDFAELAYAFALESENREWTASARNCLAIIHYNMGENTIAFGYIREFIAQMKELLEENPDSEPYMIRLLTGYNNIGNVLKDLGEYDKAMEAFLTGLRYMDSIPDPKKKYSLYINLMNNLGTVYIELGEHGKANDILHKALALSREREQNLEISITLNNLGLVAIESGDYERALGYYHEAVEIGKTINDSVALGGYFNNIGLIYEKQDQPEKALGYYQQSLAISRNLAYKWGIANTLGNIAKIETAMKRYIPAEEHLEEAEVIAKSTGIKDLIKKIHSYRFDHYLSRQMPSEALKYHLLYSQVKDSLFNEERSRQIAEMETRYETEKKEKENELLKKDIKIQKTTGNLLIMGSSGLLALTILLFQLFRWRTRSLIKEKKIRKLEADKQEIEKSRLEEQIFAEQQINRLQKEKLEQQNRELSANVIHIMNKNNVLKDILNQMEALKNSPDTDKNRCFSKVSGLISGNLNLDGDWDQFKRHFIEVHPSFFDNLQYQYPQLTAHEMRMCSYMRINLNTKEIAQMLNVSPDAVIKSRYRLRKKMELEPEADLTEFMSRF